MRDDSDDDDVDLEGMMDVEFPGGGSDDSDDDGNKARNSSSSAPVMDIEKNGWDDDAITRCWNLTLLHYENVNGDGDNFAFEPKINRKLDENGEALPCGQDNTVEAAPHVKNAPLLESTVEGTLDSNVEAVQDNPETNRWRPQKLNLPKWATLQPNS